MGYDELDPRKMLILKAIIDDYIASVEPVGSRTIAKKYDMGLSSATIRNEMADLEEMGYLSQPHTSAGRVPSDKGYRFYVDRLLGFAGIEPAAGPEEIEEIRNYMQRRVNELNHAIKVASEIVSELTQYTAIAMAPAVKSYVMKALQIVPVERGKALIVVVLQNDIVKNRLISIDPSIDPDILIKLSHIINEKFTGCPAEEISIVMINEIVALSGVQRDLLLPIIDGIIDSIKQFNTAEIYTEGTSKLLSHPEFNNIEKARTLLELLQQEDFLTDLLTRCAKGGGLVVRIGSENELDEINECSVVTATYSVNGVNLGTIGVLGPTRMNYAKVISALEYIRRKLLT